MGLKCDANNVLCVIHICNLCVCVGEWGKGRLKIFTLSFVYSDLINHSRQTLEKVNHLLRICVQWRLTIFIRAYQVHKIFVKFGQNDEEKCL